MNPQTILYFSSILLTCGLTGWLSWYAWRQRHLPGVYAYAAMSLGECFLALSEILSMIGPTQAQAQFWFNLRFLFNATVPVFFLIFALEYFGRKDWLSRPFRVGAFVIPAISQIVLWSNSLHGLWVQKDVGLQRAGPFWIADTSVRVPSLWFMVHSFYALSMMLAGIGVIIFAVWRNRQSYRQGVLLSAGALIALISGVIPIFNLLLLARFNPFVPGVGLSTLFYALAIVRFQFLKRAPAQESAARLTNLTPQEKQSLPIYLFIFILFVSGLAAASYLTYQNYERQFRTQVESQLSAIAALKVETLQNWRAERLADANLFYQNTNFSGWVRSFLENPQASEAQAGLLAYLAKVALFPEYDRIFLLDVQGIERISIPATPDPDAVPAVLVEHAAASLNSNEVVFLDFHRHAEKSPIHLSLLVPIFNPQDHQPLGVLVLRISPDSYLNSFIQSWPIPSASAETLLVRREGQQVVNLNQLRFGLETALTLRFPLTDTNLPVVRAVLGETGLVEGVDYRHKTVIADLRAVPDSPWFLVSKMDTAEVYALLRERLWQTILFFGALILMVGAGLMLIWRQQSIRFYRGQVEAAEALRSSEEKFRLAFETSPDSVAITRLKDGMFVSVNKGFEQISGYTRQQAIGKTSVEINIWKDPEDRRKVIEALRARGEIQNYEAPFLTRSGEIYGLMSAAIIELNGEPHILNITRDITERKRVEEQQLSLLDIIESSREFIGLASVDQRAIYVNPAGQAMIGLDGDEAVKATKVEDYFFPEDLPFFNETILPTLMREGRWVGEFRFRHFKTGNPINVYYDLFRTKNPITGEVINYSTVTRDITERKQAEDALIQVNERLALAQRLAGAGIWDWDLATGKLNWTPEFFHLFGLDPATSDATFDTWRGALHPDDLQNAEQRINEAIRDHVPLFMSS